MSNIVVTLYGQPHEKSNEITAIPELLDLLELRGCIITSDAMSCQKKTVEKIVSKECDYVICLKGNQETLYEDDCRMRADNSGKNFAVVRHIAKNLYKNMVVTKMSIKLKRFCCSFDEDSFMMSFLTNS